MDIYSYINSKDIAEHCRSIEHKFNALEMAYIIYISNNKTLSERQHAWLWIIKNCPDMELAKSQFTPHHNTLHQFLRDYMEIECKLYANLKKDEENTIYADKICEEDFCCERFSLFPSFDDLLNYGEFDGEYYAVSKRWLGKNSSTYKSLDAKVNFDGEPIGKCRLFETTILNHDDSIIYFGFSSICIDIPTPFKKGDIVTHINTMNEKYDNECVYVLDRVLKDTESLYSKEGHIVKGTSFYGIGYTGQVFFGGGSRLPYYDLEYFTNDIKGKNRSMLAISNYIKENQEISVDLLLNAYGIILQDEYINKLKCIENVYDNLEQFGHFEIHIDSQASVDVNPVGSDIYSHIPSRDIALHCRELEHDFTPLEQAVIIYHSNTTLNDRHAAWQRIISTLPDMEVVEWSDSKNIIVINNSLHQMLKDYIYIESILAERFKTPEPNTIYTYSIQYIYENSLDDFYYIDHDHTPYSTYDAVVAVTKKESEEEYDFFKYKSRIFRIYKRFLDKNREYLSVEIKPGGQILSNWDGVMHMFDEADHDIANAFDLINIYVPIPFRKGDILTYGDGRPFVLVSDEWTYGKKKNPEGHFYLAEGSIMDTVCSYSMRENGHVHWDFNPAALGLEYYRGELTGMNRILNAISNHIRGEISTDLLMNAYDIILHEEQRKRLLDDMWYTDEGLALVGLEKETMRI